MMGFFWLKWLYLACLVFAWAPPGWSDDDVPNRGPQRWRLDSGSPLFSGPREWGSRQLRNRSDPLQSYPGELFEDYLVRIEDHFLNQLRDETILAPTIARVICFAQDRLKEAQEYRRDFSSNYFVFDASEIALIVDFLKRHLPSFYASRPQVERQILLLRDLYRIESRYCDWSPSQAELKDAIARLQRWTLQNAAEPDHFAQLASTQFIATRTIPEAMVSLKVQADIFVARYQQPVFNFYDWFWAAAIANPQNLPLLAYEDPEDRGKVLENYGAIAREVSSAANETNAARAVTILQQIKGRIVLTSDIGRTTQIKYRAETAIPLKEIDHLIEQLQKTYWQIKYPRLYETCGRVVQAVGYVFPWVFSHPLR